MQTKLHKTISYAILFSLMFSLGGCTLLKTTSDIIFWIPKKIVGLGASAFGKGKDLIFPEPNKWQEDLDMSNPRRPAQNPNADAGYGAQGYPQGQVDPYQQQYQQQQPYPYPPQAPGDYPVPPGYDPYMDPQMNQFDPYAPPSPSGYPPEGDDMPWQNNSYQSPGYPGDMQESEPLDITVRILGSNEDSPHSENFGIDDEKNNKKTHSKTMFPNEEYAPKSEIVINKIKADPVIVNSEVLKTGSAVEIEALKQKLIAEQKINQATESGSEDDGADADTIAIKKIEENDVLPPADSIEDIMRRQQKINPDNVNKRITIKKTSKLEKNIEEQLPEQLPAEPIVVTVEKTAASADMEEYIPVPKVALKKNRGQISNKINRSSTGFLPDSRYYGRRVYETLSDDIVE